MIRHLIAAAAVLAPLAQTRAETLQVVMSGVRSARGELQVDVYGPDRKRVSRQRVAAVAGQTTASFPGLKPGAYAVQIYHDENANQRLDTGGLLGLPVEGYAFSNDARIGMGPPSFDAMRVELPAAGALSTIVRLRYPRPAR